MKNIARTVLAIFLAFFTLSCNFAAQMASSGTAVPNFSGQPLPNLPAPPEPPTSASATPEQQAHHMGYRMDAPGIIHSASIVCDLAKPFTVYWDVGGGTFPVQFSPSSAQGGTYSFDNSYTTGDTTIRQWSAGTSYVVEEDKEAADGSLMMSLSDFSCTLNGVPECPGSDPFRLGLYPLDTDECSKP